MKFVAYSLHPVTAMPAVSSSSQVLLPKAVFFRFLHRVHDLVGSLDHFVHGSRRRPECHCTDAESDWPVVPRCLIPKGSKPGQEPVQKQMFLD
jgi:hypothetical protein